MLQVLPLTLPEVHDRFKPPTPEQGSGYLIVAGERPFNPIALIIDPSVSAEFEYNQIMRFGYRVFSSLFRSLIALAWLCSGYTSSFGYTEEIPLERCDVLPVVRVGIGDETYRFLVDTAATSMLNWNTFADGGSTAIRVSTWKGTSLTSAREVQISGFRLGIYKGGPLKLPAIDLSPIAEACGGQIDGILGVDLLEKLEARLDLKYKEWTLRVNQGTGGGTELADLISQQEGCVNAFNDADVDAISDCFEPEVVLFSHGREIRGRSQMINYLKDRYFSHDAPVRMQLKLKDHQSIGNAVWFGYDLIMSLPEEEISMTGMAICRKSESQWRLLNMHNSYESLP